MSITLSLGSISTAPSGPQTAAGNWAYIVMFLVTSMHWIGGEEGEGMVDYKVHREQSSLIP